MTPPEQRRDADDRLTCECGNSRKHEGFYECDVEGCPARSGADLLCCERCGKIFEQATGLNFSARNDAESRYELR